MPHLHIRETFKSRKVLTASVAKNLRTLSHSLQVSTEGVLVLYHHRTLPVVSVSQYAYPLFYARHDLHVLVITPFAKIPYPTS